MKKWIKIVTCLILAFTFSTTLSGCTKKTTGSATLTVWSFEDEDTWKPIIKEFQKTNKSVTVNYQKQTLDPEYENRLLNSILSGDGPDIWAMPNDWVYRHKDKMFPMPDKLAKSYDLDKQFVPSIKQSVYINDKIYALAPSSEPLMIYYNPALFTSALKTFNDNNSGDAEGKKAASALLKEPPKTWTDFTQAVNLLTVKSGDAIEVSGVAMGTDSVMNSSDILYLLMMQNETSIISDDVKQATFNLPGKNSSGGEENPGARALSFYTSFANPSSENYAWSDEMGDSLEAFANGQAAMIFGFSDLQSILQQKYPNLKYKKAFAPQVSEDSNKIVDYAKFNAYGVSKLSKYPNTAWNLVNALVSNQVINGFNSAVKLYSSRKADNYDTSIKARTGNNPEKLSLATAKSLIKGRYPDQCDSILKSAIASVTTGTQDPQAALDTAANNITQLLRKESW